jgi:hypothetical protein
MLHKLISHSPDLKRLWDDGYEIEIVEEHLVIHHIPYLNSAKEIKYGTIISTLILAGDKTSAPNTTGDGHVAYFIGEKPSEKDGQEMVKIIHNSSVHRLANNSIIADHMFSAKPAHGYRDYYEKMTTYINMISAPAKSIDNSLTERTYRIIETKDMTSVFNYSDTNSSRAEIQSISKKINNLKIAIVGVGGTGSYILDLIAKTPVGEVHLYDKDLFLQHNAFRAPGAASIEDLRDRQLKVDYMAGIYSKMHRFIIPHRDFIASNNLDELAHMDFVFLCLDQGKIKESIINILEENKKSFIDVGMGVEIVNGELIGMLRVTTSTEKKRDHIKSKQLISFSDNDEAAAYSSNIQIAELNALNAALAVIKWKKLYGFYHDPRMENSTTYTIETGMLLHDDINT